MSDPLRLAHPADVFALGEQLPALSRLQPGVVDAIAALQDLLPTRPAGSGENSLSISALLRTVPFSSTRITLVQKAAPHFGVAGRDEARAIAIRATEP
jgi:hypothetical protein